GGPVAVHGDDAGDIGGLLGGGDDERVADFHLAGDQRAGKAAEVKVRAVDPLDRETGGLLRLVVRDRDGFEIGQQRRAGEPGRVRAGGDDVVALERGDRDGVQRGEAEVFGEGAV